MTFVMMTVFLSSCQKESINQDDNVIEAVELSNEPFVLPFGYDELSQEEQIKYIESLSETEHQKLVESRNIIKYFKSVGKDNTLIENLKHGDIVNKSTMTAYLSSDEIKAYDQFNGQVNEVESRGCCSKWRVTGTRFFSSCAWGFCYCRIYEYETRTCDQTCWGCLGFCREWRLGDIVGSC